MRNPSRAVQDQSHFVARGLIERAGRWYCAIETCPRHTEPFESGRSAKSHPYPAHGIRSNFVVSAKRRDRRYRSAPPAATPALTERVDAFLNELPIDEGKRRRMRRDIIGRVSIPGDAPPPSLDVVPNHPDLPIVKASERNLYPDEVEELRRGLLYFVHVFALRKKVRPAVVVDAISEIAERRFYRQGIGLVSVDAQDAYSQVPGAHRVLDRLAALLNGTAARA